MKIENISEGVYVLYHAGRNSCKDVFVYFNKKLITICIVSYKKALITINIVL